MSNATRAPQSRSLDVRRRILDAAMRVLAAHGYAGATTVRIQEEAGVSRGRLLHHYPSRDELLIAATQQLARARFSEYAQTRSWPIDPGARIDAAIDAIAASFTQPHFWAATELWLAARTHPELREPLLPIEKDLAREIRIHTAEYFGPDLAAHPDFFDVNEVLFTSLRGMALTRTFDQRDEPMVRHLDRLKRLVRRVLLEQL